MEVCDVLKWHWLGLSNLAHRGMFNKDGECQLSSDYHKRVHKFNLLNRWILGTVESNRHHDWSGGLQATFSGTDMHRQTHSSLQRIQMGANAHYNYVLSSCVSSRSTTPYKQM